MCSSNSISFLYLILRAQISYACKGVKILCVSRLPKSSARMVIETQLRFLVLAPRWNSSLVEFDQFLSHVQLQFHSMSSASNAERVEPGTSGLSLLSESFTCALYQVKVNFDIYTSLTCPSHLSRVNTQIVCREIQLTYQNCISQ